MGSKLKNDLKMKSENKKLVHGSQRKLLWISIFMTMLDL